MILFFKVERLVSTIKVAIILTFKSFVNSLSVRDSGLSLFTLNMTTMTILSFQAPFLLLFHSHVLRLLFNLAYQSSPNTLSAVDHRLSLFLLPKFIQLNAILPHQHHSLGLCILSSTTI